MHETLLFALFINKIKKYENEKEIVSTWNHNWFSN